MLCCRRGLAIGEVGQIQTNQTLFLLHMVEDGCLAGGHWLHETHQKHHYQGNGGVS